MDPRFGVIGNDDGNDNVRHPRRSRSLRTAIGNACTRSKIAKGLAIPVTMESTAEKSQVWVELDKSLDILLEQRLKAEKEDLEQKIKIMNTLPSFMIPAPGIQAAYSAAIAATQGQTMISKLVHVGM
ncbi:hypothetical protein Tco_1463609, partial [Tanacetum coccineum]